MVELLKSKPQKTLDFIIFWLQTSGKKIEKSVFGNANHEGSVKDVEHLPDSDPEGEQDEVPELPSSNGLLKKSVVKKKMAISAEAYGEYNQLGKFDHRHVAKTAEQEAQIKDVLQQSIMFKYLEKAEKEIVVGAMEIKEFAAGEKVITQGDDGNNLYIVARGKLACSRRTGENQPSQFLRYYEQGEVFGELSLLYNVPRAASIEAETNSVCFSLDRDTFSHIVKNSAMERREKYESFLDRIEILAGLDRYERSKICDCLESEHFRRGDMIIREGEPGEKFYLVQKGKAEAVKNIDRADETKVYEYGENDYFGELALLNNDVRKASIRVVSETMEVASLSKNSFKRLFGPIEGILARNVGKYDNFVQKPNLA